MKFKENILNLGLRRSTAHELFRLLCTKEKELSPELLKLMKYLEGYIMKDSTIGDMEDFIDQ